MSQSNPPRPKSEPATEDGSTEVKLEMSVDKRLADELSAAHVTVARPTQNSASASNSPSSMPANLNVSRSPSASSLSRIKLQPDKSAKSEQANGGSASPVKSESAKQAKMSRAQSAKAPPARIAPLFGDLPDVGSKATSSFSVIDISTYQNKYLGYTETALECDCSEEWVAKRNNACDEHSDCINRATKMECGDDCTCGSDCQNQRFSRRLWADVSVIQTEKKGYGLRANTDLKPHEFIFEYVGEVIGEAAFRRRMIAYDEEGIKHFYFMSLSKGEFIDATKKGNLGRFCNHSCNPNCYVDKWVIGDKLRMGIFAEKHIKAGEELVFNYNVDRYGANPQPCYCGESNCTGFIGGKTQTERGTKLSAATIEALGIDDLDDDWDTVVAKKPKKRRTGEDDEEYVDRAQSKALDPDGCTKVMAALMQCKEKWIAVKLLQRIQDSEDEQVRHRIVRLHGYRILNSQLGAWKEDENIILQILDIIDKLPRITRNKIADARLDITLQSLSSHENSRVSVKATDLVEQVQQLEMAYRIPRKQKDDSSIPIKTEPSAFGRRDLGPSRQRSRSRSKTPPRGPSTFSAPSGPKSQQAGFRPRPPPSAFPRPAPLPFGWFSTLDKSGRTYFYSADGQTTWSRPTKPVDQPPPPPKQPSQQEELRSIIDNIVNSKEKEKKTPGTPEPRKKERKAEKWRSYDEDKKKKLYENTLYPHISHVMNKYKHKIPRDDLKRFAKEIAKKLVASDFKAGRVKDPTEIGEKQQRKTTSQDVSPQEHKKEGESDNEEDIKMEELAEEVDDEDKVTPDTPMSEAQASLKRKRVDTSSPTANTDEDGGPAKSPIRKVAADGVPPPPPPPAPPADPPPALNPGEEMDIDSHSHSHDMGETNFEDKSTEGPKGRNGA
ncbi:hypothetical protein DV736_g2107, partial [Chaetothyriales sp. CBS 134916]